MAKVKCPACKQVFEADERNTANAAIECPNCKKKLGNPFYVKQAQPAVQAAPAAAAPAPVPAPAAAAAPATDVAPAPAAAPAEAPKSEFTGGLASLIGNSLLNALLLVVTLFIAYPWVLCRRYNWEIKHKVIDGKRLAFDGKGSQLIGNWIKWLLLSLITFGIYALWLPIKKEKWLTKHTHFAE